MPVITTLYDSDGSKLSVSSTEIPIYVVENLSSQANGVNLNFTTVKSFIESTLHVFLNGQLMISPDDYVIIDANTIQFISAPLSGDKVVLRFIAKG